MKSQEERKGLSIFILEGEVGGPRLVGCERYFCRVVKREIVDGGNVQGGVFCVDAFYYVVGKRGCVVLVDCQTIVHWFGLPGQHVVSLKIQD